MSKRKQLLTGLVLAIVLQALVLTGMVVKAALPLWTGQEILVRTVPVDPRSLLRGSYARLGYEFSVLPETASLNASSLRQGEIVYVSLALGEDGLHHFADASLDKPGQGIFIRGRVALPQAPYRLNYGIEAFFAPKAKALQLEQDLREGGVAVLMVSASGSVALADVRTGAGTE